MISQTEEMELTGWSDDDDFVSPVKVTPSNKNSSSIRYRKQLRQQQRNGACSDPKVQTTFSIAAILRILSKLNCQKRKMVESLGFGGLAMLETAKHVPKVARALAH